MVAVGVEQAEALERSRLGELFVRHAPDGIRFAYLLTGDRALAEDLVQEAFARFVGRLSHLRDPNSFGAYLRRTIVNLSRSHSRHARIERAYTTGLARATARDTAPNDALDQAMHDALLRLPVRQRAAMVLRFYEDLSEGRIAEVMRCRPGTVRSLVSRGMKALRSDLGGTP
jgi:RNA polymerase sigma-70 factor (sigma-E family)